MSEPSREPVVLRWDATVDDHVVVQQRFLRGTLVAQGVLWEAILLATAAAVAVVGGPTARGLAALGAFAFTIAIPLGLLVTPQAQVSRTRKAGWLALGPTSLALGPDGVRLRHEGLHTAYAWTEVDAVTADPRGLWIRLSTGQHLRAPRRALGGFTAADTEAWRAAPGPAPTFPPPADAVHVIRGTTSLELWEGALGLVLGALRGPAWYRLAALVGLCALFALTFRVTGTAPTGVPAWLAFLGLGLTAASFGVGPLVAGWSSRRLLRGARHEVLHGELEARLDPTGIWVRTSTETSWYAWSWIASVARDDRVVALVVGVGSVLALPVDAMADPDRLVADCRSWMAAAPRLRGGVPPPGRGTAGDVENAFAPPDRGADGSG